MATGPRFDSEGNLIPPSKFSNESKTDGSVSSVSQPRDDHTTTSTVGSEEEGSQSGSPSVAPKCVNRDISAKQRAVKNANAFDLAKKFLQVRRCNSFLSGPNGQAKSMLGEAHIDNFCLSDAQNALQLLRQVGRMAGMQDLDQHNAVEKWIDCFCNVTGRAICPELTAKKPKDVYDIQEHFVDPAKRKRALKLDDIPLNEDDVSGADEILND